MRFIISALALAGVATATCPYMGGASAAFSNHQPRNHAKRQGADNEIETTEEFLQQFYVNDNDTYMTDDTGTPVADQDSLKAGDRGPTLLEDFIFRQKIMRFDHERVSS